MYHIKSVIPMIVDCGGEQVLDNSLKSIDIDDITGITLKCYPLVSTYNGKSVIPNMIMLKDGDIKNCDLYSVTRYPNNHTEIAINAFCINNSQIIDSQKGTIVNSKKTIEVLSSSTSTIVIKNGDSIMHHQMNALVKYKKGIEIEGVIYLFFEDMTSDGYVYAKIKDNVFESKKAKDLQITAQKITCLCPYNDMAKQAKYVEITLQKNISVNEKTVYQNSSPTLVSDTRLVPYAFLEAVKQGNIKLARYYLSSQMNEKLKDSSIKGFFGNFLKVKQDMYNDCVCIICKEEDYYLAKDFVFDFENDKISNINEV